MLLPVAFANVAITLRLIRKDRNSTKKDSILKYLIALLTLFGLSRLILLDWTIEECKYRLWGMIMQPTKPVKEAKEPAGIVGTKVP